MLQCTRPSPSLRSLFLDNLLGLVLSTQPERQAQGQGRAAEGGVDPAGRLGHDEGVARVRQLDHQRVTGDLKVKLLCRRALFGNC